MTTYKRLWLLATFAFYNVAMAQTNYPSASVPPPDVVKAEYYFDNDPGLGNANSISIERAKNIVDKTIELPLDGISKGVHILHLRIQDATGRWSLLANKLFANFSIPDYGTPGTKPNLTEAEYFFDIDPGYGNATKIVLDNNTEIQSQGILTDLPDLSQGLHAFYLRTRDAAGKWSITAAKLFNYTSDLPYPEAPSAAIYVRAAEAFIDNDPGFGNGIPLSITPAGDISNFAFDLPLNGLSQGLHYLYVRGIEKPWSQTAVREFLYGSVLPLQWLYFKGEVKDERSLLNWGTALEVNTQYFNVQHSADGIHFTTISKLPAKSGQTTDNEYGYTHTKAASGFNFYRIQQVDKDGKSTYSKVIQLLFKNNKTGITLAPNPVINETYVIQHSKEFVTGYTIFNASAQTVKSERINALKESVWKVDMQNLKPGIYTIRIDYNDHKEVVPFIKK